VDLLVLNLGIRKAVLKVREGSRALVLRICQTSSCAQRILLVRKRPRAPRPTAVDDLRQTALAELDSIAMRNVHSGCQTD